MWDLWKTKRHRNASLSYTLKRKTERGKEKGMKGGVGDMKEKKKELIC
jgi:hypothetical protein